jgi:hypothetical protein
VIVQVVKYKTGLSEEEAAQTIASRAPQYRALPGLWQKLYVREQGTGEYGGIYVWEDEASMRTFRERSSPRRSLRPTASRASPGSRSSTSFRSFGPTRVPLRRSTQTLSEDGRRPCLDALSQ